MRFHQQKIEAVLRLLERQAYWTSEALSAKLGISRSTVQRCLEEIHQAGLGERIHGGIRRRGAGVTAPTPVDQRAESDQQAKEAIGKAAAKLLPKSGYVYLDAGTTVQPMVRHLEASETENICFVTNDVAIALILAKKKLGHILISGSIHPVTQTISGPMSQKQVSEFNFEVCFISVDAVGGDGVTRCALAGEAALKHQVMMQSERKYLLAASSKWEKNSGVTIARLKAFSGWVTERAVTAIKKISDEQKIKLIISKGRE